MLTNSISKRYLIFFCHVIIVSSLLFHAEIKGQNKYLLTEEEMPEYELSRQSRDIWIIGEGNQTHDVISQKWHRVGHDEHQNIYIVYCEFNYEIEAIRGTAFASHTNATPYIWGSFNGSIVKDGSWISIENSAMYFVRGNMGIMIFKPVDFKEEDRQILVSISDQLVNKIESNLSSDIFFYEEAARQKQMNANAYQAIIEPITHSELLNGYSLYSNWDSKWLTDAKSLRMGIRKEWKSVKGSVIGIDICKFDNDLYASNAIEIINRNTFFFNNKFDLDNPGAIDEIIRNWQNFGFRDNLSVVGVKNNIAVHVYQFDPNEIDTDLFYSIVEKLSHQIENF